LRTVAGVFSSIAEAEKVARDLEHIGIPSDSISVIAGNDARRHDEYLEKVKNETMTTGAAAASGASFGGGMGIVATLVALSIPGVGPILALGPLLTIAAGLSVGAVGGALVSTFRNMGLDHEDAPLYEEAVRRGAVIVAAQVGEPLDQEAMKVMNRYGARDLRDEADTWRAAGWSPDPHPYSADDSIRSS
jgi:uncharacterized membrane protein